MTDEEDWFDGPADALAQVIGTAENGGFVALLPDPEDPSEPPGRHARLLAAAIEGAEQLGATAHAALLREVAGVTDPDALEAFDARLFALPRIDDLLPPTAPSPRGAPAPAGLDAVVDELAAASGADVAFVRSFALTLLANADRDVSLDELRGPLEDAIARSR